MSEPDAPTLRIDVVSIFPAYLDALDLSLAGRAREKGLLQIATHDLRDFTHDRHRTVDDTPYGGGAGMVMKPEPWGEALDTVATDDSVVVVPTPSGTPFRQSLAHDLSRERHLVFACGRYEGIDQRVIDHARERWRVEEVSLGDFVLNGGEVAALAVIEAVVRLVPGFMGNPASLAATRCPTSCCPATTARSPPGGTSRRCSAPASGARTCSVTRPKHRVNPRLVVVTLL